MWRVRKFFRYLGRLWSYAIFLWGNEEWDWAYLFELMAFKLERMQKNMERDSWHVGSAKRARQLLICKNLLRRIIKDDYCSKETEDFYRRYPLDWVTLENQNYQLRPLPEAARKEMKQRIAKERKLQEADLDLFWKIFSKHFGGWWT